MTCSPLAQSMTTTTIRGETSGNRLCSTEKTFNGNSAVAAIADNVQVNS
jgi:hypothetical protein